MTQEELVLENKNLVKEVELLRRDKTNLSESLDDYRRRNNKASSIITILIDKLSAEDIDVSDLLNDIIREVI